jgi:hypothetical protein
LINPGPGNLSGRPLCCVNEFEHNGRGSSLPLLVARIRADNTYDAIAPYYSATATNRFN